ncbi:type 2 lanthipeptide synthetase LanM [Inconstantimicrobium mannanitabidum]|uniref:Uncharacterized protein n=1 Tax=Inconstantimicrobium mannanitabidum TaxID=1604901 RepID=A0ACB5RIP4_9CLOT|nr:type 2 lanthipeptide synthetase LanM [Clostridium sp. TW13]GKX68948.1 hypothetical protein rsdtw13_42060 [Clostridium sp. TW13]
MNKNEESKYFIRKVLNEYSRESEIQYEKTGVFDNFYEPFLFYIEKHSTALLETLENKNLLNIDKNSLLEDIMSSSKGTLIGLSMKILISELHERKDNNKLKGATKEETYKYFDDSFLDKENIREILDKYQGLDLLLYLRLNSINSLVSEALLRLQEDIAEIRNSFGLEYNRLQHISMDNGDTHNQGKSVIIFKFEDNTKLVYKPHGLSGDSAMRDIYSWFNKKQGIDTVMTHVNTLDKGNYGWQQFIEYEECTKKSEARDYFYRIGVLLSLFTTLKASDIHSENIIVNKDNPVLIDLETILTNNVRFNLEDGVVKAYIMEIRDSVLNNLLLPQNFESAAIDIDISGLAGDGGQVSKKLYGFSLKNEGTEDICLTRQFVVSTESNNRAALNGVKLDPLDYIMEIEKGFKDCYNLIKDNKEEFIKVIDEAFREGRYRQVLRPTFIYARYLDAAQHPKFMKTLEDRLNIFKNISINDPKISDETVKAYKVNAEVEDLFNEDVPYFSTDYETNNVYTSHNQVIENYFDIPIKDMLHERVRRLNDKNLARQLDYIRNSLLTTKKDLYSKTSDRGENISVNTEDTMETLKNIGDFIFDKALFNKDKTTCTYLNINYSADRAFIGPVSYTLYDGAGLILFLQALAKETKEEKYKKLADATLKGIEEVMPPDLSDLPTAAFSGIVSLTYLYYNLYVMHQDKAYYEKYLNTLKFLEKHEIKEGELLDVIGGAAGIIITLINIYKEDKNLLALHVAKNYGDYLYKQLKQNKEQLSGFSHGYSGFALAFYVLGDAINSEKYANFANEIIEIEDKLYKADEKNWIDLRDHEGHKHKEHKENLNHNTEEDKAIEAQDEEEDHCCIYWCHGAPGILLGRVKALNYLPKDKQKLFKERINDSMETLINQGFIRNQSHSLCHGLLGNLDILLDISKELKDNELEKIYRYNFQSAMKWLKEDGIRYGLYNGAAILTFMTGLSGIGYSLLRSINPKYPSVLALDVMKKEVI